MPLTNHWIIRTVSNTIPLLVAFVGASAQTPAPAHDDQVQLVSELSKQVHQLRIEVTALRLEWHERRMQALEEQIRGAEAERHLAEYEDAAGRDESLAAEIQLAGSDLDATERTELTGIRDALLTGGQQRLQRRTETAERESALRSQWEHERAAAEEFRRTLKTLRSDAAAVPSANPTE